MSFEKRVFVAMALCGVIWILFDWLGPKPPEPDPEDADAIEQSADSSDPEVDSKEGDAKGDEKEDAKAAETPDAEPSQDDGAPVEIAEHELRNDLLALKVSNRGPDKGGLLEGIQLLSEQFADHTTGTDPFDLQGGPTLSLSFKDAETDFRIKGGYKVIEAGSDNITLQSETDEVVITERLELLDGYEGKLTVTVKNKTQAAQSHRLHVETRVGIGESSRFNIKRGLCRTAEDVEEEDASDVEDEDIKFNGPIHWGGVDSKYFATLLVPTTPFGDCELSQSDDARHIVNHMGSTLMSVDPGESVVHEFGLYIGAKELERLEAFAAVDVTEEFTLEGAIDWGFFGGVLGRGFLGALRFFHGWVNNWGWAIVFLTVCIKLVTLPLTLKQMNSMKAMKRIQPQMAALKEKYKDDRVKQGQEMQALFAREGVNPLAGCFPMLIQMPIWFAFYSMLGAAVELVHVPFLWLPDLTAQDPIYVLPLALGAMMFLNTRMMPSSGDEAQAKMMRWIMPVMFTAFMLFLPSGLGVYIFVNTALSVIQTAIQVGTKKDKPAAAK